MRSSCAVAIGFVAAICGAIIFGGARAPATSPIGGCTKSEASAAVNALGPPLVRLSEQYCEEQEANPNEPELVHLLCKAEGFAAQVVMPIAQWLEMKTNGARMVRMPDAATPACVCSGKESP